ncbi:MAG TPA: ABC transporter substrate-binding protein, partial [Thermotogota bacterium]|nr:ABC transporter substrate-binding protein [Thermotogota bacterium]
MRKLVLGICCAVLLVSFAFAAPVTVEFWHAMGGGHGETLAEIVKLFNQQNADMQINAVYIGN